MCTTSEAVIYEHMAPRLRQDKSCFVSNEASEKKLSKHVSNLKRHATRLHAACSQIYLFKDVQGGTALATAFAHAVLHTAVVNKR